MKKLLVVVDMQNDFVSGVLGGAQARAILPAVRALAERETGDTVFTQDTHGEDYLATAEGKLLPVPHCIKGTQGWEIVSALEPFASGKIFEKSTFGSLELARYAAGKGYTDITLCGVCTDICVISNAVLLKAFCPEATVRVVSSACAGTSPENHNAALLTMKSCQIVVE